jgi:TIR domain
MNRLSKDHREEILTIIRRALERGESVEIDGLGAFRRRKDARYELIRHERPQVFVAYIEEDLRQARRICRAIEAAGSAAWLNKEKLLPGQDWPRAIQRAVELSDAFVACFSRRSAAKHGEFQNELRWALKCARLRPLEASFLIPVRLEPCEVPRSIAETLQYVDLFPDWEAGMRKLVRAIRKVARPALETQLVR